MTDVLTQSQRSYCMSRIKGKDTKPEIQLRKALWAKGMQYRLKNKLIGNPDIHYKGKQIAIFVDGCFWHGCPIHSTTPQTKTSFWKNKILKNIARDRKVTRELEKKGWRVLRFWEHDINDDLKGCIDIIQKAYYSTEES